MAQRQFRSDDTSPWIHGFGNGSDGATAINTSTDATANTTISVTSGSTAATAGSGTGFAAGNLILIHQSRNGGAGAGAWELNQISSVGSGTDWTLVYPTTQAYDTTAQVYLLKQYSTVTVNSSQTLTSAAWDGTKGGIIAFLCNNTITVDGNISGNTKGFRGGAGGKATSTSQTQGEGTSGAGGASTSANGNGGGGGRNNSSPGDGGGGGGGNGATGGTGGTNVNATGGTGGSTAGDDGLVTMVFGGGGGGEALETGSGNTPSNGAAGGGLVLLIAPNITVTGSISVSGGTGSGGTNPNGGSGAGGSILIKGQTIILGSSLVTASAGSNSALGGAAGAGRIHADYLSSLTGTTSPTIDTRQDTSLTIGTSLIPDFI